MEENKVVRKKQSERSLKKIRDFKDTFESEPGKRVLWELMKEGKMLGPTFVAGDSHASAFYEGKRSIVGFILTILKKDEEDLLKLIEQGEQDDRASYEYFR